MADETILNNLPYPGILDKTSEADVQERADDMNDYLEDNSVEHRIAVCPQPIYIMFPVDSQADLDDFNALSDAQKLSAYKAWLGSITSYPPL